MREETPSSHVVRAGLRDAGDIVRFLALHPEVAMQAWQGEHQLRRLLQQSVAIAVLARSPAGDVEGALVGGVLGTRGMVNHIAVKSARRGSGLGGRLVREFESALREHGIRRYFLFTSCDNWLARRFWTDQGCAEMTGMEITYERDF